MIADQMRKLFAFNSWAWQRVFASVEKLDDQAYHAPRHLFNSSIHGTLVHCLSAESIWLARCEGDGPGSHFDPQEFSGFAAVRDYWQPVSSNWTSFVQGLNDEKCAHAIEFRSARGDDLSLQLVDILQHVVNHATEHRSQLTPVLYHLDVPTKPLDYIHFQLKS